MKSRYRHLRRVRVNLPKCGILTTENLTDEVSEVNCPTCLRIVATPESVERLLALDGMRTAKFDESELTR